MKFSRHSAPTSVASASRTDASCSLEKSRVIRAIMSAGLNAPARLVLSVHTSVSAGSKVSTSRATGTMVPKPSYENEQGVNHVTGITHEGDSPDLA